MSMSGKIGLALRAWQNVLLGGNLASLPLATRPRQLLAYTSETLFQYQLGHGAGLPRKPVYEAFPLAGADVRLGCLDGYNWLHSETPPFAIDLLSLVLLCRGLQPRTVFEIGTFVGYTALHMALNTPADARICTLDLPREDRGTRLRTTATDHKLIDRDLGPPLFAGTEAAGKVERLFGDSATFDFSPWHGAVDLFFVDGAHSYDYVRSDTLNALKCVRPGGVVAWHDYGRLEQRGVTRFLHEFARDHAVYAVPNGSVAYHQVPEGDPLSGS
ncbi:MAG TPA: class I SAM-dependent methyltransferase [Longimicrobiales bacterium]|nr:class I SAM-dependent methyltransferase [Longimicrobiales bacterium]